MGIGTLEIEPAGSGSVVYKMGSGVVQLTSATWSWLQLIKTGAGAGTADIYNDGYLHINSGAFGTLIDFNVTTAIHGVNVVGAPVCAWDVNGTVRVKSYTVATLPAANAGAGQIAWVTDGNTTTRLATVTGGGSTKLLVGSDGTNWLAL